MKSGLLSVLALSLIAMALPAQVFAQVNQDKHKDWITAPAFAAEGETLLLCASSRTGGQLTADILDGSTGVILATQQLTLPTLGTAAPTTTSANADEPPDPCLTYTAPSTSLFVGRITLNPQPGSVSPNLNPQPLPPGIVAPSLQIFMLANGAPSNIRIVGFQPPDPCLTAAAGGCLF